MKSKTNLLQKIRGFVLPFDQPPREGDKEVLPFFFLITLALLWMYGIYIQQIEQLNIKVIFSVLMLIHLVLYWTIFRYVERPERLRLYFLVQGLLAMALILLAGDFGLSIGLYSSLIGNAAGALRQNKDIVYVIFGFLCLAVLSIILVSGIEIVVQWSYVAIPSAIFSTFIAFMFRRQLEVREKTQHLLEELQIAHTQLADYAERVEELTLANERQRMARELHDTLAQGLTGLVLQLEAVSTHIEKQNGPRAQEILHRAMTQARTTLAESRKVIDNLRSSAQISHSLAAKIRAEAQQLMEIAGVPCEVEVQVTQPVAAEMQEHLIKIVSEGLYNIAKHAQANQAWLRLTENKTHLVLEIEDDGLGLAPDKIDKDSGHYGLLGIRERVALMQGEFSMDSQPEQGTCLLIQVPSDTQGASHDG